MNSTQFSLSEFLPSGYSTLGDLGGDDIDEKATGEEIAKVNQMPLLRSEQGKGISLDSVRGILPLCVPCSLNQQKTVLAGEVRSVLNP